MTGKTEEIKAHKPYKIKEKKTSVFFFLTPSLFPLPRQKKKKKSSFILKQKHD